MRKHIFKTSNIYIFLKQIQKDVKVLAVCMKTFFFIYICIFVTFRRKPGILNTRFVFLQYKNTKKNHKTNTQKNNDITRFIF
jgi:hypothetical protein